MTTLKRWLPVVFLCILIFTLSALPGAKVSDVGSVDFSAHKSAHLFLFFLLTITFYRATKNVVFSVILTILYGATDEFHQLFVATREGSIMDLLFDSFGALVAGGILWKFYQNLPKKLRNWLEE